VIFEKLTHVFICCFYSGAVALFLISCGGGTASSLGVEHSTNEAVAIAILNTAPITTCPSGGITVQSGIDTNMDHVLQLSEASSTQFVCNGSNGVNGVNGLGGISGFNTQLVITPEGVGPNCLQGGSLVSAGLDLNGNSVLDSSEVTTFDYVCNGTAGASGSVGTNGSNGTNGTNGSDGTNGAAAFNSLVGIGVEPAGKNCVFGGSEVTSGLDKNADNILDKDEVTSTAYVCHGATQTAAAYAYIYNLREQRVGIDEAVRLDSNGVLLGISHEPGAAEIHIRLAGVYTVIFSLSGAEPSQFGLFVNGLLVPGSVFGSGAGTQQNNGQVTLVLAANDVITVVNHSSAAAVTLPSFTGGKQDNVNASVSIQKIGE
jgi:hypothetical protein